MRHRLAARIWCVSTAWPFLTAVLLSAVACERKSGGATDTTGDILVGFYGSLTGDGASFGQSSREGAELAVDELNAAGGVLGRQLRLLVEDDQSKPEEASNAVTKLITQDRVVAVVGEVASRRTLAAAPIAQRYQIPMITPASTNEKVTEGRRLCLPRLLHRPVSGRGAREIRLQRPQGAQGRDSPRPGAGLLRRPTDSVAQHFTRLGAGKPAGELLERRRRLQGSAHAHPQRKAGCPVCHRLLLRSGDHHQTGARARHEDADPWRRRLGRRRLAERARSAQHVHLQSLFRRQPGSDRPELRQPPTRNASTATPTPSPRSATTRSRCWPTR